MLFCLADDKPILLVCLLPADLDAERIIAIIDPVRGVAACCASHILAGPGTAEYKQAVRKLALASVRLATQRQ